MKKYWSWIVSLITLLAGMFLYERNRRKQAEAELVTADGKAKDQLLHYQQDQNAASIDDEKKKLETLRKDHDTATQEDQKNLSPEQVQKYWNRKP